jgi:hypothetical protein
MLAPHAGLEGGACPSVRLKTVRRPPKQGANSGYAWSVARARTPGSNIEIIFADWLDAMRRGDLETMASRLAPDVVHQGVSPELICRR